MKPSEIDESKSIPFLKALSVFAIILANFQSSLFQYLGRDSFPDFFVATAEILYYPIFYLLSFTIILSGILLYRNSKRSESKRSFFSGILLSIVFIHILTIIMNYSLSAVFYGISEVPLSDIFRWRITNTISYSFLIVYSLSLKMKTNAMLVLSLIIALSSSYLYAVIERLLEYLPGFLTYLFSALLGIESEWPIFPWISLMIFGFFFARKFSKKKEKQRTYLYVALIFAIFSVLLGGFYRIHTGRIWELMYGQPEISFLLGSVSIFIVLFIFLEKYSRFLKYPKYGIVNSYSTGILFIYIAIVPLTFLNTIYFSEYFHSITDNFDFMISYLIMFLSFLLLSWILGALSIKIFHLKKVVIRLKKI